MAPPLPCSWRYLPSPRLPSLHLHLGGPGSRRWGYIRLELLLPPTSTTHWDAPPPSQRSSCREGDHPPHSQGSRNGDSAGARPGTPSLPRLGQSASASPQRGALSGAVSESDHSTGLCQRQGQGHLPNTYPQGTAAAPAGVGRAAAFPGHLLPHLSCHCPVGTGRGPLWAGKLGQQGPENRGFEANKLIVREENPGCGKKKNRQRGQENAGFQIQVAYCGPFQSSPPSTDQATTTGKGPRPHTSLSVQSPTPTTPALWSLLSHLGDVCLP